MNKRVCLPLLSGGHTEPSISFFPGIIGHLFSLQLLSPLGTKIALKQRGLNVVLATGGLGIMGRQECSRDSYFPSLCLVGGDEIEARKLAARSSQELRNN